MTSYSSFFYSIYLFYFFRKLVFYKKIRAPFSFKNPFLATLLINYYLMWKNIFKFFSTVPYRRKRIKLKFKKPLNFFFSKTPQNIDYVLTFIKNNYITFFFFNNFNSIFFYNFFKLNFNYEKKTITLVSFYKKTFGEGYVYLRGLIVIFFIDASFTDDEPLWEPIEWSLVQTWILFIFLFAWIAENLITSRYGSYTGRDKRVWFAWYKTYWLIELSYVISYCLAALLVIVPFYYELTYSVSFIVSWWNWYSRVFFFKFISTFTLVLFLAYILQLNIRWLNWKKLFFFILIINFFIFYLLYTHFIMTFFGYFTDPIWYQKTRQVDYIQLSHEPLKWGWGPAKRDHYTYHKVSTVFWFKNDGPFAGAFLMFNMFFFLSIFFLYIYWLILLRRVYNLEEITYTLTTFCVSALKQFFYFFLLLYFLILMSFIVSYWRFPIEFLWMINSKSWFMNFLIILKDYFFFLIKIFL